MTENAEINSGQCVALPLKIRYGHECQNDEHSVLTGVAIVAFPTGEADTLAARAAAIVAEVVVPRPAQVLATLAVIVRRASHPVLILHLRVGALVLVHGPLRPDVQPLLGGQPRDQYFV